jgi:hypothetical protein
MSAERHVPVVKALERDPRVRLLYVFGSTARGEAGPRSDLDLAVWLDRKLSWDEERDLRATVSTGHDQVDLVILNDAPPVLRYEVVTGGRCLLARDAAEHAEFEITSLARFLDFQPIRRVQREYLRRRVEERRGSAPRSTA